MKVVSLEESKVASVTIMVFVEGTIMAPKAWWSLYLHQSYVPIGHAVEIINGWNQQGATIIYCTSLKGKNVDKTAALLKTCGFKGNYLIARELKESYKNLVEQWQPDVLVEDDCASIGGSWQMCITNVNSELKESISSYVIKEFRGIDHLPRQIQELNYKSVE